MRIVMTGATRGIGLVTAKALLARGRHQLFIGARNLNAAAAALPGTEAAPLDLASLASTRDFAARAIAAGPIDALIFNAGLQVTRQQRSTNGYELTFAANHLAHHLLLVELLPHLAGDARVILTASGTHDPAEKTGMPPPHHADARRLAFPNQDPLRDANAGKACRRAYSTSKLCNVMTARELARRTADRRPDLMIASFDPGYIPETGLARDYPAPLRWLARNVIKRMLGRERVSTAAVSGALLARLVDDPALAGARGTYWSARAGQLVDVPPSTLARDDAACAALWDDSLVLEAEAARLEISSSPRT